MKEVFDILIVDDDRNMRLTLAEILEGDYLLQMASSGEEAADLCRQHIFRLVLMDVRMPGIDGLEAYRRIRRHCKRSQVVLMSAYTNPQLEAAARREGVLDCIRKPLDIESVMQFIAHATSMSVIHVGPGGEESHHVSETLHANRFRVSTAHSIHDAIAMSSQILFDAVLLDLDHVPDGPAAVAALRDSHPQLSVLLTGESPIENMDGAYAFLAKPVKGAALVPVLEEIRRAKYSRGGQKT